MPNLFGSQSKQSFSSNHNKTSNYQFTDVLIFQPQRDRGLGFFQPQKKNGFFPPSQKQARDDSPT